MAEVPWFSEPPDAHLWWSDEEGGLGHLKFIDPNDEVAIIPVTKGESYIRRTTDGSVGSPIWHIEVKDDIAIVSPSVHYIGFWHSPNPVRFRLVDKV